MRDGLLWAVDAQTGSPTLVASKYLTGLLPLAWTANDELLYFEDEDFSASAIADGLPLSLVHPQTGSPRALKVDALLGTDMAALSTDGRRLAVSAGIGRESFLNKRIVALLSKLAVDRSWTV